MTARRICPWLLCIASITACAHSDRTPETPSTAPGENDRRTDPASPVVGEPSAQPEDAVPDRVEPSPKPDPPGGEPRSNVVPDRLNAMNAIAGPQTPPEAGGGKRERDFGGAGRSSGGRTGRGGASGGPIGIKNL